MPNFAAAAIGHCRSQAVVLRWVHQEVVPRGRSNPLRALEMALAIQPDVIFLLSENITGAGPFEIEADRLLAALEDQNPVRPDGTEATAIKCIQFLEEDVLGVLRQIAEVHGGPDGTTLWSVTPPVDCVPDEVEWRTNRVIELGIRRAWMMVGVLGLTLGGLTVR